MMLTREIDRYRAQLWMEDLLAKTGQKHVYALGAALDPASIWIDASSTPHQSKWYRLKGGAQVPSNALVKRVRLLVPSASFDVHHPVWRVLRRRDLSDRSVRRLVAGMPPPWHAALARLNEMPASDVSLDRWLVSTLALQDLSFLDAVFLVECARRQAAMGRHQDKGAALTALLYSMPLLFADDQIWWRSDNVFLAKMFDLFDRSLGLDAQTEPGITFPIEERLIVLSFLQQWVLKHLERHPRALATAALRRRHIAGLLAGPPGLPFRIGARAYKELSATSIPDLDPRESPVDERLWRWAWYELQFGDFWARHIDHEAVAEIWVRYQSKRMEG
jgi:hypothetical protein